MKASKIIEKLNEVGGANGIGIIDIVENRLIGMKDQRRLRDAGRHHPLLCPRTAGNAHQWIRIPCTTKQKLAVDLRRPDLQRQVVFSADRRLWCAFANESNKYVTGSVKLKLYKGNIIPAGTTSPYSLYSEEIW